MKVAKKEASTRHKLQKLNELKQNFKIMTETNPRQALNMVMPYAITIIQTVNGLSQDPDKFRKILGELHFKKVYFFGFKMHLICSRIGYGSIDKARQLVQWFAQAESIVKECLFQSDVNKAIDIANQENEHSRQLCFSLIVDFFIDREDLENALLYAKKENDNSRLRKIAYEAFDKKDWEIMFESVRSMTKTESRTNFIRTKLMWDYRDLEEGERFYAETLFNEHYDDFKKIHPIDGIRLCILFENFEKAWKMMLSTEVESHNRYECLHYLKKKFEELERTEDLEKVKPLYEYESKLFGKLVEFSMHQEDLREPNEAEIAQMKLELFHLNPYS
jgi:hypothetical protein